MTSAAQKGQYWKSRTKKWLEAAGYQVAFLERVLWLQTAQGRIPIKKDQFASDLLAVNETDVVFVQVKGGESRRSQLAAARRAFQAFCFPPGTKQWIVLWAPQARKPEVVVVSEGPCGFIEQQHAPARTRKLTKADLPLLAAIR